MSKDLKLVPLRRCVNYPCRAPRAAGDALYCAKCREEITTAAWLAIQTQEVP